MVAPIFVLGLNRNGTTWLQNVLCNHPEIVGAQHKVHWGIKESNICGHTLYWGDFEENDEFIKFLELYSNGDHFKLADGDKEYFYKNRPEDFIEFFFEMMDYLAKKNKSKYWTTKLDPLFYRHTDLLKRFFQVVEERYEKMKFIGIKREYKNVLESAINMQGQKRWRKKRIKREIFSLNNMINYAHGYNSIEKIISERNGILFDFNLLKNNREKVVKRIVKYLNLDYSEKMLEDYYPANSSYRGKEERITLPNWEEKLITELLLPIFQSNESLPNMIQHLKNSLIGFPDSCPLYFRLLKMNKMKEDFKKELEEKGRIGLKKMLFEDDDDD